MNTSILPAAAQEIKTSLVFPNQTRKNFWVTGPSGQIIQEFTTEREARAFMAENKFFIAPKA